MLIDTSYALIRRLTFVENAIREYLKQQGISTVMAADIGCGTGELLTIPLSIHLGKDARIYAYEPDSRTFQTLKSRIDQLGIQNILPMSSKESLQNLSLDVIIISEVLEHVEDPAGFLLELKGLLKDHGIMIITTPNGYGIFELETLVFNSLDWVGIIPVLRKIKRSILQFRHHSIPIPERDTLAISPHINFFTLGDLRQIIAEGGLSLKKVEGKQLAAGPFSDRLVDRSEKLVKLNADLGGKVPLPLAADWMLIAENTENRPEKREYSELKKANLFKRVYTNYKRWLNVRLARRTESNR